MNEPVVTGEGPVFVKNWNKWACIFCKYAKKTGCEKGRDMNAPEKCDVRPDGESNAH